MQTGRALRVTGWVLTALALVVGVGGWGYFHTAFAGTRMTGASMEPTLAPGDLVVIRLGTPETVRRGDVVQFGRADAIGGDVVERAVAIGGDRISYDGTTLRLNGRPLHEAYVLRGEQGGSAPFDVTVERGRIFLMGDHRLDAADSRFHLSDRSGTVPLSSVRGRVLGRGAATAVVLGGLASLAVASLCLVGGVVCLVVARVRRRGTGGTGPVAPAWGAYGPQPGQSGAG